MRQNGGRAGPTTGRGRKQVECRGVDLRQSGVSGSWIMHCTARFSEFSARIVFVSAAVILPAISLSAQLSGFGTCKPISQRTAEVGCWILVDQAIGRVEQ